MEDFKFKIGDFVKLKLHKVEKEYLYFPPPLIFMIIERICHECAGGVQKHYMIRLRTRDGLLSEKLNPINEIELEEI